MKKIMTLLLVFSLLISITTVVKAQTKVEKTKDEKKNKIKVSFSERARLSAFDNAITLNKNTEPWVFSRCRTYLGLSYYASDKFSMVLQLGNEARYWFAPSTKKTDINEFFVNKLYIHWKNIGNLPIDFKIGRQNIMLDEGFICLDGQPLTGSRSAYFNAIRSDIHISDKQTITAFYSYNPKTDNLLPIINEMKPSKMLEEQSNRGLGLYYRSILKQKSKLSLYYFYKGTIKDDKNPIELKRNTLGGRIVLPFSSKWNFKTEGAFQFGKTGAEKHTSYGGYLTLEYSTVELPIFKKFSAGSFYLSGDDPKTAKTENWDPLWSRFPKWSESYIYTLIIENKGKVAYWSNMASLHLETKGQLSDNVSFNARYHYLLAPKDNISDFCSGNGKHRGNLLILMANYKINKHWSGHLLWENFNVGNFYYDDAEGYNWIRFELMYRL